MLVDKSVHTCTLPLYSNTKIKPCDVILGSKWVDISWGYTARAMAEIRADPNKEEGRQYVSRGKLVPNITPQNINILPTSFWSASWLQQVLKK